MIAFFCFDAYACDFEHKLSSLPMGCTYTNCMAQLISSVHTGKVKFLQCMQLIIPR